MKFPLFARVGAGLAALSLAGALAFAHGTKETTDHQKLEEKSETFAHAHSTRAEIGQPIPEFAAQTFDGRPVSPETIKGQMTVVVLADTTCPCVQAIEGRLLGLNKKYGAQGLQIAYLFSNPGSDTPDEAKKFLAERKLPFLAINDLDQKVLEKLDGKASSELYLFDKSNILRYHGRLDDNTFKPEKVKSHDLENAIVALTKNEKIARPETSAMGCAIARIEAKDEK